MDELKDKPTTPGKILFNRSAAVCAFGFPPSKQSSKSNSGCRTGFEYETRDESTNVMFRMPQPYTSQRSRRENIGMSHHQSSSDIAS